MRILYELDGKRVARLAPYVLRRVQHVEGGGSISRVTECVQARRGLADFHAGVPAYARQRPSRLRPPALYPQPRAF